MKLTERDRADMALVIGSCNRRTRHVYVDGNDACLLAADALLASEWLAEYVARHVNAALTEAAERIEGHICDPVTACEDFNSGGPCPYEHAARIVRDLAKESE